MSSVDFPEWLKQQIAERQLKPFHLAKAAGLNASTILHLLSGEREIGSKAARDIARALELPQIVVFQAAGLITEQVVLDGEALDAQMLTGLCLLEAMTPEQRGFTIELLKLIRAHSWLGKAPERPNRPAVNQE
jgi:hypothetical protein